MATVIDQLLVGLDLDASKFDPAVKKAAEAWLKLRQQAERAGKETLEPIEQMDKGFTALTGKVLKFAAAFLTVQKAISVSVNLTKTNVDLSNLSKTTQISTETLSKWENVAERSGSSVQSMRQAISGMDRELKELRIGGGGENLTTIVNSLNQAGAGIEPPTGSTTATEMWMRIIEGMDRIKMDPRSRAGFLQQLGYADPSVIALFMKGSGELKNLITQQKAIYSVTEEQTEASLRLNKEWYELEQRAKSLGQVILHDLVNPIATVINSAGIGALGMQSRLQHPPESAKGGMVRPLMFPWFGRGNQGSPPSSDEGGGGDHLPPKAKANSYEPPEGGGGMTYRGAGSYYSGLPSEGGSTTSTGDRVDPNSYTGALQSDLAKKYGGLHKGGVWADVTDEKTGKKVRVFLNDTGPLRPGRIVDLSPKAFKEFGSLDKGVLPNLKMQVLPPAPAGQSYKGGPVDDDQPFNRGTPPLPWLANPGLLRAPRFNMMTNPTNNYSSSETTVHSMIVNSAEKAASDDAYGLSKDAVPALERGGFMNQMTEGPF